jgi:hypothetical protein
LWNERAARFYEGEFPWTGTVSKLFGNWNALIKEAGFTPRPYPKPLEERPPTKSTKNLVELAEQVEKTTGERQLAALHELASSALKLAAEKERKR